MTPTVPEIEAIKNELNDDLRLTPPPGQIVGNLNELINSKINTAVDQKIKKINEGTEAPQRMSGRLRLLNEAIGKAAEERKRKAEQVKREAEAEKEKKIQEELARLRQCIADFGQSIKFIQAIPVGIFKDSTPINFAPPQFYKLLPKVLARMISSINSRIVSTEIKPGPGTAETLNSLGLPDPGIKIQVDDEEEQGGGSSSRSRIFGITKRKKNNKILRRLNSKNKKNPRKILYGGRGVRYFGEHAQPIPQCDHTIGNYHEYVNPTCYICGEPWIEGVQSSMECEHILCVIHGIEYYGLLQSVYLSEEQKKFLSILYAWAHRCCNQRKRNIAFIRKNPNQGPAAARGNYFVPDDVNIRELLSDIFTLSTYPDNKSKFDCNKIFKKVRENKKQFVDKRTAVVTSYVTPLVACVNTVFTGLFEANMVLFNAIGCLKIIAEMSIYLTAVGKTAPGLKLELGKTASFMSEIVFPGCAQPSGVSANGGGGRRIIQDKKTRKLLRRKIQRGGAPKDIIDAISGLLAQQEYEKQIGDFKNAVDVDVEQPGRNPSSSRALSDMLNGMFTGDPSPSEPPPSPLPRLDAPLTRIEDPTKIDAILFILFVLNHSRNPTVLLGLFLDLKKHDDVIVGEQTRLASPDDRAEPEPVPHVPQVDVGANIRDSLATFQTKRRVNKTAFIHICLSVFRKPDTMISITRFLTACDMMPSFVGVVMFCARQTEFDSIKDEFLLPIIGQYMSSIDIPRFHENVKHTLRLFQSNIVNFLHNLQGNRQLFTSVAPPETPLDHLVTACFHLKRMVTPSVVDPSVVEPSVVGQMLLHACYLFPSCFDEDIFSQFGPCDAYVGGVLKNPHFQAALGCVASAKTMCARISIEKLTVTLSKHSPDEQRVALELFSKFFDKEDNKILSGRYTGPPRPAILSSSSFGSGLATYQTSKIEETINEAIQNFGENEKNDEKNFVYIIIGMNWANGGLLQDEIPTTDASNKYIREQLLENQTQSADMLASYLREKGNTKTHKELVNMISVLFQTIESKLPPQKMKRNIYGDPATVQKKPSEKQSVSRYPSDDEHDSQDVVVDRINNFVRLLLDQRPNPDSQEEILLFGQIDHRINELMIIFNNMYSHGHRLTKNDRIGYLTHVIALLLPQPSAPPSPSSETSQGNSPPRHERQPVDIASEILETYNYFQDESFEDDDITVVYKYIMNPGLNNLKNNINISRQWLGRRKLEGGSSPHNTKRQHRKKQKIKSRRKNKYNTTKTRKNRNS